MFHLGAQAHVGESWHRPYETVTANTLGTLNLLQSIVDHGLELEKFDTAGTSEEYGNVREAVAHHHDFDDAGSLILHERSPINPKSIYATSKVAADFLTMNYHDAFGVPGIVTRMFNNYGPRQNPRYVTGTIITQALEREEIELGQLDPLRDFCFCTDGVRGHLTVAAQGIPGDVYVYGQGENISMGDWCDLIIRTGEANGFWPAGRRVVSTAARYRPGASEVMALRVGYEKLNRETGWKPKVSWEEGVLRTIRWYAENRDRWIGRVDWTDRRKILRIFRRKGMRRPRHGRRRLPRLAPRRAAPRSAARTRSSPGGHDYDLTRWDDAERLFADAEPELVFHLAAEVGGIGANRAHPGRYWYANLLMGAQRARAGPASTAPPSSCSPAPCARTRSTRRSRSGRRSFWNGYPEETNAPYGVAKKSILVGAQAYREQYGTNAIFLLPDEPVRAARQLRPRRPRT